MQKLLLESDCTEYHQGSLLLGSREITSVQVKSVLVSKVGKINTDCPIPRDFWHYYFCSVAADSFVSHDMPGTNALRKRGRVPTKIKTKFGSIANKFTNIRIYAL